MDPSKRRTERRDRKGKTMFYAIEYAYGRDVVNGGQRADRIVEFTRRQLRDVWVAAGATHDGPGARDGLNARTAKHATWRDEGDDEAWRILAEQRVSASPALTPYRYDLIEEDWCDPHHARWVATAPEREIVAWARSLEAE
jgi:hypothetical protein